MLLRSIKEHKTPYHLSKFVEVVFVSRPGQELYVKKIHNGTVIDHISAGHALDVLKILNIDGHDGNIVSIAMNVASKHQNKKDIVKVEGRELKPSEVDKIALIAPGATINIIREFEVAEKNRVKLPDTIGGIVRCANPSCISNAGEPVARDSRLRRRTR